MKRARLAAALIAACLPAAGAAAEAGSLALELNKLEPVEDSCRVYSVYRNGAGAAVESLKLDLIFFDRDGVIARRLAVQAGPLPAGKTMVRMFDVGGLACGTLGKVLVNDVMACEGLGDCLARLSTDSRVDGVPLIK